MRAKEFIKEITGQLRISPRMERNAIDLKAQLIVLMSPEDFLSLTSSKEHVNQIHQGALPLYRYNQYTKIGDNEKYKDFISKLRGEEQYGSSVHPFLQIEFNNRLNGVVTGHEGRHRAAALIAKNSKKMPVAILLRDGEDNEEFKNKMDVLYHMTSEHLPKYIQGQFDKNVSILSKNWKIIKDDMLAPYRRNR